MPSVTAYDGRHFRGGHHELQPDTCPHGPPRNASPAMTGARRRRLAGVLAAVTVAGSLAACGGGGDDEGSSDTSKSLTVWIEEDLPDRVAATQKIVDAFEKDSGITVKLVAVAEDQFN